MADRKMPVKDQAWCAMGDGRNARFESMAQSLYPCIFLSHIFLSPQGAGGLEQEVSTACEAMREGRACDAVLVRGPGYNRANSDLGGFTGV
jgi:hypothetical protein